MRKQFTFYASFFEAISELPVVLVWYLLTELGSILENAVRLGAKVPAWLAGLLLATKNQLSEEENNSKL